MTSNNPNVRPPADAFFVDITRGYKQRAAYTTVDFDLIPSRLTLSAGTRYSSTETQEVGSTVSSYGCGLILHPTAPNPCVDEPANHFFINLDAKKLDRTYSGFKSRANLSWNVTDDALLYYTWSQGFRAGGFNRTGLLTPSSPLSAGKWPWQKQASLHNGWTAPLSFAPDNLTNNELGWKSTWMNRRIQWDGAIYQENWDNAQISVGETGVINLSLFLNGGDYRVRGVETSLVARVTSGLSIEAAGAWNQSALVKPGTFFWNDGTPIDFSLLKRPTANGLESFPSPGGTPGTPLAGAPPFQGNVRMRYDFTVNGYDAFAQIGVVHQSHSFSTTSKLATDLQDHPELYELAPFTTYDGALGTGKDGWLAQLYAENLTDARAQLFANYFQFYKAVTVNRPRTIGLRFSYKFGAR